MKFETVERLLQARLNPLEEGARERKTLLEGHEKRIVNLEKWRAYILGAAMIVAFLVGVFANNWPKVA